jgi:hypothetical protein
MNLKTFYRLYREEGLRFAGDGAVSGDKEKRWRRVGPLRYSGPPRPVPLPERPPQGKLRTDSTYDWREIGEQVTLVSDGGGVLSRSRVLRDSLSSLVTRSTSPRP